MSEQQRVDLELDRMLSGGGLSGPEEDAILNHVLDEVAPAPAAKEAAAGGEAPGLLQRLGWWLAGPPVLAAAAFAIFIALPAEDAAVDVDVPAVDTDGFKSRGDTDGRQSEFGVEVSCGLKAPCIIGEALLLSRVFPDAGFVSAALVDATGAWMWLFEGESVSPGARFDFKANLPADLAPGSYQLRILFDVDKSAVSMSAVKAAFASGAPKDRAADLALTLARAP